MSWPGTALSFANRAESSPDSDSSTGIGARETYKSEKVLVPVIEAASFTPCKDDVTASGTSRVEWAFRSMWRCPLRGCKTKRKDSLFLDH